MKKPQLDERNQKIREQFSNRRGNGETSKSIMEALAQSFYLSVATIRYIVYCEEYGVGYTRGILRDINTRKYEMV